MKSPGIKLSLILGTLALALALPAVSVAAPKSNAKQQSDLEKYDTNHDGKIDRQERETMRADKQQIQDDKKAEKRDAEKKKDGKKDEAEKKDPAAEKPADGKPADEKAAAEKPAEEKPAGDK